MDDERNWHYRRWRDADESGREDDADAACRALFAAGAQEPAIAPDFAARTLAAIAAATADDARRARRARRAAVVGGVAAAAAGLYAGGPLALSLLSRLVIRTVNLLVDLSVSVAMGVQAGTDTWSLLGSLGRATAAFVSEPAVTVAMFVMQGVAMAALIALQRLLGPDRESLK